MRLTARSQSRLAAAALISAILAGGSCLPDATGPRYTLASFSLVPRYVALQVSYVPFTSVRITISSSPDVAPVIDTVVAVNPGVPTVVELRVPLRNSAGEDFMARMAMIDGNGDTVFVGSSTIHVTATPQSGPPVIDIPLTYSGTGANAVRVVASPNGATVGYGGEQLFTAVAYDVLDAPIPGTPIGWASLDPLIATVPDPSLGRAVAGNLQGTARIVAGLPTGQQDTVSLTVDAEQSSGKNWTGAVSTDWSAAGNWSPSGAPGALDDVTIPFSVPRYPTLTANVPARSLTVITGANVGLGIYNLTVSTNITVLGTVTGTGHVIATGADVSIEGPISNLTISAPTRFDDVFVAGTLAVSGTLLISSGGLEVGNHIVTAGTLTTSGNGILAMTGSGGQVTVNGTATFGGEDPTGVMTAGVLHLHGNLVQAVGVTTGSLVASGTHRVVLDGTGTQTLTFATPGTNGSRLHDLEIANVTGPINLGSDVTVTGMFSEALGPVVTVLGGAHTLRPEGVSVSGVVFSNALVEIGAGAITSFDNVAFNGYAATAIPLRVTRANGTFTFTGLTFSVVPSTGAYLRAQDTAPADGQILTINLTTPTPGTSGGFVQTAGGALVNWPGTGGSLTWTGAVDGNWSNAGNWNAARVPTGTDNVIIAAAGTPPVLSAGATVNNLTVQPSASLGLGMQLLIVTGSVDNGGIVTGTIPGGSLLLAGSGGLLRGTFTTTIAVTGSYLLNGRTKVGFMSVSGTGADIAFGGHTLAVDSVLTIAAGGTITMNASIDSLIGSSLFFGGQSTAGRLTAGTIAVAGTASTAGTLFQSGSNSASSFAPSGTNKVVFTGVGGTVGFTDPAQSFLNMVEVRTSTGGVDAGSLLVDIKGDLSVLTATYVFMDTVIVRGNISTIAGSTLSASELRAGGGLNVLGSYLVNHTLFNGDGQGIPSGLAYEDVTVSQTGTGQPGFLTGAATINGDLRILDSNNQEFFIGGTVTVNGDVTFSGPTIFDPAGFTLGINGNLSIQSGARLLNGTSGTIAITGNLLVDGAAMPGPSNATVRVGGNFTQSATTSNTNWMDGITFNGSGTQNVSFATPGVAAARMGGTTVINKSAGSVVLLSNAYLTGSLQVGSGTLDINGHTMRVAGTLLTVNVTSFIRMVNALDSLVVAGTATFNGGNQLGLMSNGVVMIAGNFSQLNTYSGDSYHPSVGQLTVFNGINQSITFASPGIVPGTSHFQAVRWTGAGTLTLGSNFFAHDAFGTQAGANGTIKGTGAQRVIQIGALDVDGATFDSVSVAVSEPAVMTQNFKNVTFTRYPSTSATVLSLNLLSAASPRSLTFDNIDFVQTLGVGAGNLYVRLTGIGSPPVTITIPNSNQGITAGGNGEALSSPANHQPVGGLTISLP